jgi:hypothetical protein
VADEGLFGVNHGLHNQREAHLVAEKAISEAERLAIGSGALSLRLGLLSSSVVGRLVGRPLKLLSSDDLHKEVGHGLASVTAVVGHNTVSILEVLLRGNFGSSHHHVAKQSLVLFTFGVDLMEALKTSCFG